MTPVEHAFEYRLFMMYLDLSELERVFSGRWFWSTRRAALARFRREDHLGDPGQPLDEAVRDLVESETGHRPAGAVRLLTNLRYFGYGFNPVSFYYCYGQTGEHVEAVVAEGNNTPWGERHCYVMATEGQPGHPEPWRHSPTKRMHVSPFMPMDIEYAWRLGPPADTLNVHMENHRQGQKLLDATLRLERRAISAPALARVLLQYPLMTLKVIAAIHWQALRLWLKRVPIFDHPAKSIRVEERKS
jgi:DUF1365 family protein